MLRTCSNLLSLYYSIIMMMTNTLNSLSSRLSSTTLVVLLGAILAQSPSRFSLGLEPGVLRGKRVFKNYPTAYAGRPMVSKAINARVQSGKTLRLGPWKEVVAKMQEHCPEKVDAFKQLQV